MFTLEWPWMLLLLPLPGLVYGFIKPVELQSAALKVPFLNELRSKQPLLTVKAKLVHKGAMSLLWLIWCLLVLAVAQPLWVGEPVAQASTGRDLMLAVDISGSMETEDMVIDNQQVNRLVLVKKVLDEFVQRRQGDRVGLILFGSEAYIQTPLTYDHRSLLKLLNEAQIGFAGEKTAIGDAIGLAIKRLKDRPDQSRVLVLLTDGANTAGTVEPLDAAAKAAEERIKLYTLGVGADEMIVRSLFGSRRVNPSADLDEQALTQMADLTGGQYFRARDGQELEAIYRLLDKLEPAEQEQKMIRPQQSYFHWPLGAGVLLSLLWASLKLLSAYQSNRQNLRAELQLGSQLAASSVQPGTGRKG